MDRNTRDSLSSVYSGITNVIFNKAIDIKKQSDFLLEDLLSVKITDFISFNERNYVYMQRLMNLNLFEKEVTLNALGISNNGERNEAAFRGDSDSLNSLAISPNYANGMDYVENFSKQIKGDELNGVNSTRLSIDNGVYNEYENLYPDDLDVGGGKDFHKWDVSSSKNSILNKTKKLFNNRVINSLISRFGTGADEKNNISYNGSSSTKYGESRGRNLLKKSAENGNNIYDINGYNNPYCRVWTHHYRYDKLSKTMRSSKKANDVNSWGKNFIGTDDKSYKGGYWKDGNRGWDKTVLDNNGMPNITPKFSNGNPIHTKDCMFSIENLAWKGYDPYTFENSLSWEQRGPNGGRIMWFPPYGINFSESTNANWSSNTFIGRGEDVYTYINTNRSGSLNFLMVVDHPSVIDYALWDKKDDSKVTDNDILRFFAGCDSMDSSDSDSIMSELSPTPLEDELKEEIEYKTVEKEKVKEENSVSDEIEEDTLNIMFPVFFPNNYSGCYDYPTVKDGDVDAIAYLLAGIGSQKTRNENREKNDNKLFINDGGYNVNGSYSDDEDYITSDFINLNNFLECSISTDINILPITFFNDDHNYIGHGILGNGSHMTINLGNMGNINGATFIKITTKKSSLNNDTIRYYDTDTKEIDIPIRFDNIGTPGRGYEINSPISYGIEEQKNDSNYIRGYIGKFSDNSKNKKFIPSNDKIFYYRIDGKSIYPKTKNEILTNTYDQKIGKKNSFDKETFKLNIDKKSFEKEDEFSTDSIVFSFYDFACAIAKSSGYSKTYNTLITNAEDKDGINILSDRIKSYNLSSVDIKGYASLHGNKEKNFLLSKNRGETIKNWLKNCLNGKWNDILNETEVQVEGDEKSDINIKENVSEKNVKMDRVVTVTLSFKTQRKVKLSEVSQTSNPNNVYQKYVGFNLVDKVNGIYKDEYGKYWVKIKEDEDEGNFRLLTESEILNDNKFAVKEDIKDIKNNIYRYDQEYFFFKKLEESSPLVYKKLIDKLKYFDPAFHSMTPEGFNGRLTFLQQCMRQGDTKTMSDKNGNTANNLAFGRPPFCVLRIGDFYNQMIVIDSLNIDYNVSNGIQWDFNVEGAGVQPLLASVTINFKFIGGGDLSGPIKRLQNAMSFNYYANSRLYDNRADRYEYKTNELGIKDEFDSDNTYSFSQIKNNKK